MSVQDVALLVALPLLGGAVMLAFLRLARGPNLADRVVALDLISTLAIGIIGAYAIAVKQPVLLDVALVLALVSFLGTVAFAYYIERRV